MQKCGSCKKDLPVTNYAPSYRGKPGTWCRSCFAAFHRGELVTTAHDARTCGHCGQQYVPRQLKSAAAYCSRGCKDKAKNVALKAQRDAAKAAAPLRECPQCGDDVPITARVDAVFCSAPCNAASRNLCRKMRARGAPMPSEVTRAGIAARDRWRCGICREPVNPSLHWPHLRSGSLDHIVPIAEGGGSDPANLRLAHLTCNARRRNLGGNEQLAMFG
jgi:5-methylcytosine-specific restriction endonuclease McrA